MVRHPEVAGCLSQVEEIVSAPSNIYASTSQGGGYLFVKQGIVDQGGRFLRVVVGLDKSVKSAYYSSATGSQLWP